MRVSGRIVVRALVLRHDRRGPHRRRRRRPPRPPAPSTTRPAPAHARTAPLRRRLHRHQAAGDAIPNIDSVKSTIRAYYNAKDGIADKTTSPYIGEMADHREVVLAELPDRAPGREECHRARRRRHHAVDLRHGGRGDEVQLRPRAPGRAG